VNLQEVVVEVRVVLPAPREQVFALLSDVERMGGLGPENVRTQWESDEHGVGARFRGWNERDGRAWDVPCTVVEHDPPVRFAWVTGPFGDPSATWSYELADVDGGTQVQQRFQHGPGFTYLRRAVEKHPERAEELLAARTAELERNMRATLEAAGRLLHR
jgi:uncharacterized protein YndB with AHSA1/START domain